MSVFPGSLIVHRMANFGRITNYFTFLDCKTFGTCRLWISVGEKAYEPDVVNKG